MTDADYRDMASEIRDLIPLLMHAQAVADFRLLADRYERRAHYLEVLASNHRRATVFAVEPEPVEHDRR
jgi:hypothetical protein